MEKAMEKCKLGVVESSRLNTFSDVIFLIPKDNNSYFFSKKKTNHHFVMPDLARDKAADCPQRG